ncbi:ABC transporter substrate-binding protein [Cellulomonas oligotrophica]|uniref:ABC transporter substrate-binding protein n=1 Tax=Cellulomonas oligotrophica TaxID=931536 RepID=A0A7Y9FGM6_9CELL|nr:ABC transporter substrate-binding protein [Cellulomonas oligotrophica]NYD86542.1 sn-glycerol 3-phosphate transport system substrate-binding protein [Cellulomonas oligotrophica]GIG32568.1 ABC transporter substrate-binding protein [Cellulomonas oligotrophica]
MSHPVPTRRRVRRPSTLVLGALAAVGALTLTACTAPGLASDGETQAGETESVDWSQVEPASEITWWSNHPGASQEVEEELIARFEAEHPEISVNLVTAGANYDEVAQRFQAASQTDALPDLVISSDVWWFRYHLNDQIMPLDDVFEHLGSDTDDYVSAFYGDYEYEGQHWAAPYARSTPLFYYNKDMWEAAGLPDRGPETWAELAEWSADLEGQVAADSKPFGLSTGPSWAAWWFENMIWGQGGQYSDEWETTLDTPEAIAGGEFLRDLFHGDDAIATVSEDSTVDFSAGVVAATIGSTGSLKGILDAADFEVGTAFLPDGPDGGGVPTGGTGLAIPASRTPERQLAAAMFLQFITDTEQTAYFSQNTGYMPVRTSAIESEEMQAVYEQTPQFRTAVDQLGEKARSQDWIRVFVPGADQILTEGIEEIVLRGTDPKTAFEQITPDIETAYRENVEPYL